MPCNCDHLEPTGEEIEYSKIACLLDEFKGIKMNKVHWRGMHPKVYSQTYDKYQTIRKGMKEDLVASLSALYPEQLGRCSLEMQIWWRDYKKEETKKADRLVEKVHKNHLREQGLSKLTKEEKEALGLK